MPEENKDAALAAASAAAAAEVLAAAASAAAEVLAAAKTKTSDSGLETEILAHLSKLNTKMNLLISDDGESGAVPRLQADVKAVEKKIWYFSGAALGIGGLFHYIIDAYQVFKNH